VVINDLDLQRITVLPDEADSPLIVDSNAVLSRSITLQPLKPVRWWNPQRIQTAGGRENFELSRSQALKIPRQPSREPAVKDPLGLSTLEGLDHEEGY
jgi:hypothetical protein